MNKGAVVSATPPQLSNVVEHIRNQVTPHPASDLEIQMPPTVPISS